MSGASLISKDSIDPILHRGYLDELAAAYVPAVMPRMDPRISVLNAKLDGLPPTLIQVGSSETLLDDSTRFAAAAGSAAVSITLEVWPHMIHAWHLWNAHLEPARRALNNAGAFIRRHL
jgi:acetyl esterase/lipase